MSRQPNAEPWGPPRQVGGAGRIVYRPREAGLADAERSEVSTVVTVLSVDERLRVDAAGRGLYTTVHQETVAEVAVEMRRRLVGAVLLSALALAREGPRAVGRVSELARAFPAVPVVVLVSGEVEAVLMFALGRGGVHTLADVRRPEGWAALRRMLAATARPDVARLAAAALAPLLVDASADVGRFVAALFEAPARVVTVRDLSRGLGVLPTTLMSRFFRAELPPPKRFLAFARLTRAAYLMRNPAWTVAAVADHLQYSSAQSFSRHLYLLLGVRPAEFRRRYDTDAMLARFGAELLAPYGAALRDFWPLRRG